MIKKPLSGGLENYWMSDHVVQNAGKVAMILHGGTWKVVKAVPGPGDNVQVNKCSDDSLSLIHISEPTIPTT